MIRNKTGQASIILIVLAAVALIFFAISLNWGRIAQIKTLTTVAATQSASVMVSNFASYGEQVLQTTLGGRWQICKSNSILAALITLIIVIVVVAVSLYICGGACTGPLLFGLSGFAVAGIAVAAAAINLILQVTVVQPGLTRLWNRMQSSNMSQMDQFLEQGIQTGLMNAISDNMMITDYQDLNTNGRFGNKVAGAPEDVVSRFGFFYTERLKSMARPSTTDLGQFLTELSNFVTGTGPYVTGLPLTIACTEPNDPRCNNCCVPDNVSGISRPVNSALPPNGACTASAVPPQCPNSAPWPYAPYYPLAYDPSYPNYTTDAAGMPVVPSFLAGLGVDAEVQPFQKTEATGLYSLLWSMDGLLTDPNRTPSSTNVLDRPGLLPGSLDTRTSDGIPLISADYRTADTDCADDPSRDPLNDFYWKPGADRYCSATWPYDSCAKHQGGCATPKPTAMSGTASSIPSSCGCEPATATQWPEDSVDEVVYNLKQFYVWAQKMAGYNNPTGINQLMNSMDKWYPEAMKWLGQPCNGSNDIRCFCDDPSLPPGASGATLASCNASYNGGYLRRYRLRLINWENKLEKWLNPASTAGASPTAWCVPPTAASVPSAATNNEVAAILSGGAAWGSLKSVVQCLKYESDTAGGTASDVQFKRCFDDVTAAKVSCPVTPALPSSCAALPRSLMKTAAPGYDPCASPSNYLKWVKDSETLASTQVVKFAQRAAYLEDMMKKGTSALTAIQEFLPNLTVFLTSGGYTALLRAYAVDFNAYDGQVPDQLIYGWQDRTGPVSGSRLQGYWHIVKVKVNIPGRCSSGTCLTNRLPWVRTFRKGFLGMTRCYELTDYTGRVMASITRWDENHDPQTFANKIPLWRMLFDNPRLTTNKTVVGKLSNLCGEDGSGSWLGIGITSATMNALFTGGPIGAGTCGPTNIADPKTCQALKGAFMINGTPAPSSPIRPCFNAVNTMLLSGIKSQVCAEYSLNASRTNMDMKFVPCAGTL